MYRKSLFLVLLFVIVIRGQQSHRPAAGDCPAKCLCFRRTVRCMFLAMDNVPRVPYETTILDLRFNNIREVRPGTFSHLSRLGTLMLNNNKLSTLRAGAFQGLANLKFLYLYKNRIHMVEPGAFNGMPKLEQLYLHSNLIHMIHEETFAGLRNLERLFLHNNKIQRLPSGAFHGLSGLRRLRLDSNALVCDCDMLWLVKMVHDGKKGLQAAATCNAPETMAGRQINTMTVDDFHCRRPEIMEGPRDVEVTFGGSAVFTCRASGDPKPKIVWMKDSNEIPLDNNPRYRLLADGSLIIDSPSETDAGEYECMAKSTVGEVKSRPARLVRTATITANVRPRFISAPISRTVSSTAKQVVFNCVASGTPSPEIKWTHNNVYVENDSKRFISVNGSLTIKGPLGESDSGSYRCEASNLLGKISTVADLQVTEPPRIIAFPQNTTVKPGGHALFSCVASGNPLPRITWYKDGKPLAPSARIYFGDTNTRLHVDHAKESDSGIVSCQAVNNEGTAEAQAILTVAYQTNPAIPPKLLFGPFDMEVFPGSSLELPCKAEGEPRPSIQWRRNEATVPPSTRYRFAPAGSLYIANVTVQDAGRYECFATNEAGRTSQAGVVTVRDETNIAPGDRFVRIAFAEASRQVDQAVNQTVAALFGNGPRDQSKPPPGPADLFRLIRFPDAPSRELARAAEVYERTLENIAKHVSEGKSINMSTMANSSDSPSFKYEEILSPEHLELVAELSGCLAHRRTSNCTDMCFHSKYRTIDGSCNNLAHPMWGASLTGFRRSLPAIYENGFSTPFGWTKNMTYAGGHKLPGARQLSTALISTDVITSDHEITHMVMQWGQFLDHDLDHAIPSVSSESWDGVDCKKTCDFAPPCYPIEVPADDPRITNRRCIDFTRSSAICGSGATSVFFNGVQHREQINQLTSFIDASQVYGFSDELAQQLRNLTSDRGLLREGLIQPGRRALLPFSGGDEGVDCRRNLLESDVNCFVAGDIRANEQVGLLAMHTVWMREHNRIATELKLLNSHWDGDTIFQETRKIVGAEMQHITYKFWLPHILGEEGMRLLGKYEGYDPQVNPSIANVFATAALRFGHTLINPILHRLNESFEAIQDGHLPLHKAFFAPWRVVDEGGVDPLLRGLFTVPAKLKTSKENLNSDLTERLFKSAHAVALDLAAINIQRARDHAIPGYNAWRAFCNMTVARTFDDLAGEISSSEVRQKLEKLYGHPDNVDVFVGGILEDQANGARIGPLFRCLLVDQFRRLRDGDRFWYENPSTFKPEQLTQIKQASLGRVLCDNGDNITKVTKDVFVLPEHQEGGYVDCKILPEVNLKVWTDCEECSVHDRQFGARTSNPNLRRRNLRRPRRNVDHSNTTTVRDIDIDSFENELNEERIEGIESIIENFQKTLKQMRRKIRKLEQECVQKLPKHGHCIDSDGNWRINNELWNKNSCTQCTCNQHQITCTTTKCPKLSCTEPLQVKEDECCPVCPEAA